MELKPLHVGISVKNLEESLRWYNDVLSFELVSKAEVPFLGATIAFVRNGDFELEIFAYKEPRDLPEERKHPDEDIKTIGTKHLAFRVSNLAELMAEFRKKQVDIVLEMVMDGSPMSFIRDNSGILIEFIEVHSSCCLAHL